MTTTTATRGAMTPSRKGMIRSSAAWASELRGIERESDHGAVSRRRDGGRRRLRPDDLEHGPGLRHRRRRVLPAKGDARERLEPRLDLRIGGRRVDLQMEVRAGGVAGRADEADRKDVVALVGRRGEQRSRTGRERARLRARASFRERLLGGLELALRRGDELSGTGAPRVHLECLLLKLEPLREELRPAGPRVQ